MSEELDNLVYLDDGNGNEVELEFLDLIEYNGYEYVVLYPTDESMDNGEVIILQIDDTDIEEESYITVEDEEVLSAVFEIFKEKFKDEYSFD